MIAERYDVVVIGAGNAGLCAALAARERGARVLVLEKAPREERGGNTAFTGGLIRFPFDGIDDFRPLLPDYTEAELAVCDVGRYTPEQYAADCMRVTEGLAEPELVEVLVNQAYPTMLWMRQRGVRWIMSMGRQAIRVGDVFRFYGNLVLEANGGGLGLSDREFEIAQESGVEIWYQSAARRLLSADDGRVVGVEVRTPEGPKTLAAGAVVLAAGGFQANTEMRARYLGAEWDLAKVRGSRFNTGEVIRMALDLGAQSYGHWSCAHAVAWDLMAPPTGDRQVGDLFQKYSYHLGIIVNQRGQRFVDEGSDLRNYTYAKLGREIIKQPGRMAFQIFDAKLLPLLREEYRIRQVTRARANSLEGLADQLTIDPAGLRQTVDAYNASIKEDVPLDLSRLDGRGTVGISPPKSNWAQRIEEPPFEGYAVTCGISFTFGGLRINTQAQVLDLDNHPIPGLYACGELVGGLFYYNYVGGSGLMAGAVFGRIAGTGAAS